MKPRPPLWKISVETTPEAEEAVAELLNRTLHDTASTSFDLKRRVSAVSVYSSGPLPGKLRNKIRDGLDRIGKCGLTIHPGRISIAKIRHEDWAESWKRHFHPIEAGQSLLIKPSWSRQAARKGQAVVILDPGLSFGTGQHPTTWFCLREIARFKQAGRSASPSLLDLGCGSGILAIAAAKLGFQPVTAIDFDPEAVRVARANARVNGVSNKIRIARGDVSKLTAPQKRFDVVCANLISNLLLAERQKIVAPMNPGGILLLAGILKSEFSEVQRAYEERGLKLISAKTEKEWRSGIFRLNIF